MVSNSRRAAKCLSEVKEIILNNWKPLISLHVGADTLCSCCDPMNTEALSESMQI